MSKMPVCVVILASITGCKMVSGFVQPSISSGGSSGRAAAAPDSDGAPSTPGETRVGMSGKGAGGGADLWPGGSGTCESGGENHFADLHPMGDPPETFRWEHIAYLGDLDGDKDLDVLTFMDSGTSGMDLAGWHENKGNGKFTYNRISQGGNTNTRISVADLDGDGDMDVVHGTGDWGDAQPGGLAIYENTGRARGWKLHWIAKGQDIDGVWAGDLDGDKATDIAFLRDDKLYWVRNTEGGTKWSKPRPFGDLPGVKPLSAHDLDRDGDADFVYFVAENEIGWLESIGGKSWKKHVLGTDLSHRYADPHQSIEVLDLEGDGDLDLVAGKSSYHSGVHVFLNGGKGAFEASKVLERDGNYEQAGFVTAVDLDGDRRVEVLAGSDNGKGVHTFAYDAKTKACNKASAYADRLEAVLHMRAGDMDGDGDPDLVVAQRNRNLRWLENNIK